MRVKANYVTHLTEDQYKSHCYDKYISSFRKDEENKKSH